MWGAIVRLLLDSCFEPVAGGILKRDGAGDESGWLSHLEARIGLLRACVARTGHSIFNSLDGFSSLLLFLSSVVAGERTRAAIERYK